MARKRETGGIYQRGGLWWVHYRVDGERYFESTGTANEREARSFLALRRREIREGTWTPPGGRVAPTVTTVKAYADEWIKRRRAGGVKNAHDAEQWINRWLLERPIDDAGSTLATRAIADVTRADVLAIVLAMQSTASETTGRPYAPRTVLHVYQTIRLLFADAVDDGHVTVTPCTLSARKGQLPVKRDADPRWRARAVYTRDEAEALISDERIPLDRRVYYGLQLLAGMRAGEAAGRRWRDIDTTAKPLAHMLVHSQVSKGEERDTKTGDVREAPIHPTLAKLLGEWKLRGFPMLFGSAPSPDDFVIPSRRGRRIGRTAKMLVRLKEDLTRLGLRTEGRGRHAMRATFLTLCEVDGANMSILARMTHRSPVVTGALGGYLRSGWADVCGELMKLRIELRRGVVVQFRARASGDSSGDSRGDVDAPGKKKPTILGESWAKSDRGDWIRTSDPQTPSLVR